MPRISKWNFQILFIVWGAAYMHRGIYRRSDSTASFGVQIGRSNCCTAESYPFWGCESILMPLCYYFHWHCMFPVMYLFYYQDCYFSKNFILFCSSYFTKYYHNKHSVPLIYATSEWVTLRYLLKLKRVCLNNYFWAIFQPARKFSCNKWKIPPSLLYKSCSLIR